MEKSYAYFICLLTENCYGDYVEGSCDKNGSFPVCVDFSVARRFDNVEDAHKYAKENVKLNLGEYAIHGFYV